MMSTNKIMFIKIKMRKRVKRNKKTIYKINNCRKMKKKNRQKKNLNYLKIQIFLLDLRIRILKQSLKKSKLNFKNFQNRLFNNSKKTNMQKISMLKNKTIILDKINTKAEFLKKKIKVLKNPRREMKMHQQSTYQAEVIQ